jgi:hypothetical protein
MTQHIDIKKKMSTEGSALKSSKYSYIGDILHHKLGGDVVKEWCGPKPKVFVPNLDGTNL